MPPLATNVQNFDDYHFDLEFPGQRLDLLREIHLLLDLVGTLLMNIKRVKFGNYVKCRRQPNFWTPLSFQLSAW
jgi:hypothetical protein